MNPEILVAAKKNRWSIVASIAAGLSSLFTLTFNARNLLYSLGREIP